MIELVMGMVLTKYPDTPMYVLYAKVNEFIELHISKGTETVIIPSAEDFIDERSLRVPINVLNIEFIYIGATRMKVIGADAFYTGSMRRDEVYLGKVSAYQYSLNFSYDVLSQLPSHPVKIVCSVYNEAEALTLPGKYKLALYYYLLHSIALDAKEEAASYYYERYQMEYNPLRLTPIANTGISIGTDL